MRVIFLFFLLANAAYFYTQSDMFKPQTGPVILKPLNLPEGVERLTLLRERGLGTSSAKTPEESKTLKKNTQSISDTKIVESDLNKQPVKKTAPKPAPKKVAKAKVEPDPEIPKPAKSSEPVCFTLGPFRKTATANHADKTLSALEVAVKQRRVSQRKPRGHWVYLPSYNTYEEARREVNLLQKKGLKDLFIMGKGEYKNAISLGLFKREAAAEERYQLVKKMGLGVKKETQYQVRKLIWLDITAPGDKTKTIASLAEVADNYSRTNLSQRKCN